MSKGADKPQTFQDYRMELVCTLNALKIQSNYKLIHGDQGEEEVGGREKHYCTHLETTLKQDQQVILSRNLEATLALFLTYFPKIVNLHLL